MGVLDMNSCESCESTENLIEYSQREASGGQFCGGTWYLCTRCDDEISDQLIVFEIFPSDS